MEQVLDVYNLNTHEAGSLYETFKPVEKMLDKIWYGRHGLLMHAVETGRTKVVDAADYPTGKYNPSLVRSDIWGGAEKPPHE